MADFADMQARLKILNDAYAAQLPEKLEQIELAWSRLHRSDWDEEGFLALHRMVHSLTGSGKTFGFALLSDVARNLEEYLRQLAQVKTVPGEEQRKRIQVLLSELHQVSMLRDASSGDQPEWSAVVQPGKPVGRNRIFVVEDEHALAEELKVQLGYFGYDVCVFNTLADFRLAMQANPDVVVLMDVTFPESSRGGIEMMKEI